MTSYIELVGPYIYNFGDQEALEEAPEVGSRYRELTVIKKTRSLIRVCDSASPDNCKICVETNWAKRKGCEVFPDESIKD